MLRYSLQFSLPAFLDPGLPEKQIWGLLYKIQGKQSEWFRISMNVETKFDRCCILYGIANELGAQINFLAVLEIRSLK